MLEEWYDIGTLGDGWFIDAKAPSSNMTIPGQLPGDYKRTIVKWRAEIVCDKESFDEHCESYCELRIGDTTVARATIRKLVEGVKLSQRYPVRQSLSVRAGSPDRTMEVRMIIECEREAT